MDTPALAGRRKDRVWLGRDSGTLAAFKVAVERETKAADWPHAAEILDNIPVYEGDHVRSADANAQGRLEWMAEWTEIFDTGPGVIVIRNAIADPTVVGRASEIFTEIINEQRRTQSGGGDHFARPGANDRVWNALEKHCLADPGNFARYFATPCIALPSLAWLGAGYQVTAQVNRVNPGGEAQTAHRDYHLGFMGPQQIEAFPAPAHVISPRLTLQGAIAHCDMPVESGPTMLLPYSQTYFEGYIAFSRPEFQDYFRENNVQLPLKTGDAVFFNPAVMHAAGTNRSKDIYRLANLLQISSAFGRAMESVNRVRMAKALYPALLDALNSGSLMRAEIGYAIASAAEGYSFPTNLDSDPPVGGMAPQSQAAFMAEAFDRKMPERELAAELERREKKRAA